MLWSNIFFLIPLFIAVTAKLYLYASILGAVFVFSSIFHYFPKNKFLYYWDVSLSGLLMFANFFLLGLSEWALPYSALAITCAVMAILSYTEKIKLSPNTNHILWHFFSAGVCFFCLLSVITIK